MDTSRLFIAIRLSPDKQFLEAFQKLQQTSNKLDKLNWIKPENLHITLKFLGETPNKKIPLIESTTQKAIRDIPPFCISLDKMGLFGSRYQPRVLWLGSEKQHPLMQQLHTNIEQTMSEIGFKPTFGNIVTHLTLARIHKIEDKKYFLQHIEKYKHLFKQEVSVEEITLFQSILSNKHTPVYHPVKIFKLEMEK